MIVAVLRGADAGAPNRVRAEFAFEGAVVLLKEVGPANEDGTRELVATFRVHRWPEQPAPKFVVLPVTASPCDVRLGASYLVRAMADEAPSSAEPADRTVRTLHDAEVELTEIAARRAAA